MTSLAARRCAGRFAGRRHRARLRPAKTSSTRLLAHGGRQPPPCRLDRVGGKRPACRRAVSRLLAPPGLRPRSPVGGGGCRPPCRGSGPGPGGAAWAARRRAGASPRQTGPARLRCAWRLAPQTRRGMWPRSSGNVVLRPWACAGPLVLRPDRLRYGRHPCRPPLRRGSALPLRPAAGPRKVARTAGTARRAGRRRAGPGGGPSRRPAGCAAAAATGKAAGPISTGPWGPEKRGASYGGSLLTHPLAVVRCAPVAPYW